MSTIGTLEWRNQNSLTPYPFEKHFEYESFIVSARFIQFDGFKPILRSLVSTADEAVLTFTIDLGTATLTIPRDGFSSGQTFTLQDGLRFIGKITFGDDAETLFDKYAGGSVTINRTFLSCTVTSIPSFAGVYSLNTKYGVVDITTDENIFADISGNTITLNAAGIPDQLGVNVLKTLNGVSPTNNAVIIEGNRIIKFEPGFNTVKVSVAGANPGDIINDNFPTQPTVQYE